MALAVVVALPAEARAPKKGKPAPASRMRAEDDPRKRGNHWAFAKASIAFAAPKDVSVLGDGAVEIRLVVKGYKVGALQPGGPVPHVHLIVDNDPALEIDDARVAWALGGLAPGPHLLRAVLCRPWHEVVKARKAFAMTRFWVGPRLAGKAGRAAEWAVWPAPRKPILTYVLPIGPAPTNLVLARLDEGSQHDAANPVDPTAAWLKPSPESRSSRMCCPWARPPSNWCSRAWKRIPPTLPPIPPTPGWPSRRIRSRLPSLERTGRCSTSI